MICDADLGYNGDRKHKNPRLKLEKKEDEGVVFSEIDLGSAIGFISSAMLQLGHRYRNFAATEHKTTGSDQNRVKLPKQFSLKFIFSGTMTSLFQPYFFQISKIPIKC